MQKYKDFWNESFDRLDDALAEYMAQQDTDEEEKEEK